MSFAGVHKTCMVPPAHLILYDKYEGPFLVDTTINRKQLKRHVIVYHLLISKCDIIDQLLNGNYNSNK